MKKFLVVLGCICCLQLVSANDTWAFTKVKSIPTMNVEVVNNGNGVTSVNYSRPVVFLGTNVKKRPPYYKACKKKLGYWDENLCAQYYIPKMFEEWDKQEQEES